MAEANKFKPSQRIINAIISASNKYKLDPLELTAIAIIESGLGKYSRSTPNRDGTFDKGLFQINTINQKTCKDYNLDTTEGSSLCAALLISRHKRYHKDYLGMYHSKTPSKKQLYLKKIRLWIMTRLRS